MTTIILIIHVIVCFALIMIVLLQTGKGAEMGASFGGSNQTVFGSQGAATFLSKVTTAAAILFMLTSLSLAVLSSRRTSSVVREGSIETTLPGGGEGALEGVLPGAPPVPDVPPVLPAGAAPGDEAALPSAGAEPELPAAAESAEPPPAEPAAPETAQ